MTLPSLKALQAFDAVARSESIGRAAEELGVSASAVTQHIKALETNLGLHLFERAGGRLRLNEWGRVYHRDIGSAFRLLSAAQTNLIDALNSGEIVLSALPTVAAKWLPSRLFQWQERNGTASLKLVSSEEEPQLGAPSGSRMSPVERVHLRITYGRAADRHDHRTRLFRDSMVAVRATTGGSAVDDCNRPSIHGPLLNVDWGLPGTEQPSWDQWAAHVGVDLEMPVSGPTFTVTSSAIDAAIDGRGTVLAPFAMVQSDIEQDRLLLVCERSMPLPMDYFIAWDRSACERDLVLQLKEWLTAQGRAQSSPLPLNTA